jgi:fatty acid amide hydrolase
MPFDMSKVQKKPQKLRIGYFAIKPSESRLLITNSHGGFPGKCRLGLSFGFFTHNVGELINLFDLYLNSEEHLKCSPRSISMPFDMSKVQKKPQKLRIGYFADNGFLKPIPSASRVVRHTVKMLEAEGHEVFQFDVPHPQLMAELVFKNILPDGGQYMKELFNGDLVDENMTQFLFLLRVSFFGVMQYEQYRIFRSQIVFEKLLHMQFNSFLHILQQCAVLE